MSAAGNLKIYWLLNNEDDSPQGSLSEISRRKTQTEAPISLGSQQFSLAGQRKVQSEAALTSIDVQKDSATVPQWTKLPNRVQQNLKKESTK